MTQNINIKFGTWQSWKKNRIFLVAMMFASTTQARNKLSNKYYDQGFRLGFESLYATNDPYKLTRSWC
jgi:hypothetical protein